MTVDNNVTKVLIWGNKMKISGVMLLALGLLAGGMMGQGTAEASQSNTAYVVKTARTKAYHFKKTMTYTGRLKNTKALYVKVKRVRYRKQTYLGLKRIVNQSKLKNIGNVAPLPVPKNLIPLIYVRQSSVKKVKTVLSQRRVKKTAYTLQNTKHNFWQSPIDTRAENNEVRFARDHVTQTLYVTETMTTRHGHYAKVQTAAGKSLGWIYQAALQKGSYVKPMTLLLKGNQLDQYYWTNNDYGDFKIASLSEQGTLKTLMIQNTNGTATVLHLNDGKLTYSQLPLNRKLTAEKTLTTNYHYGNVTKVRYLAKQQVIRLSITLASLEHYEGESFDGDVKVKIGTGSPFEIQEPVLSWIA